MVRFDARKLFVALYALTVACGESHQPGPPVKPAKPAPAATPPASPSLPTPSTPAESSKTAPDDTSKGEYGPYIWQSGPIAAP